MPQGMLWRLNLGKGKQLILIGLAGWLGNFCCGVGKNGDIGSLVQGGRVVIAAVVIPIESIQWIRRPISELHLQSSALTWHISKIQELPSNRLKVMATPNHE